MFLEIGRIYMKIYPQTSIVKVDLALDEQKMVVESIC